MVLARTLAGAPADYEGRRIVEIRFDPPEQPLPADELVRILPLRVNEPLRATDVRAAIERLHTTGRFSDIAVDAEPRGGDVALRFITEMNWFIGRVAVVGAPEPPNRGQLANATKLELGKLYTDDQLQPAVANLLAVLRANGFWEASVQPTVEREPASAVANIVFRIDPGPRAVFAPPILKGDLGQSPEKVAAATGWKRWGPLPGWRQVTESRVQQGLDRLRRSYLKRDRLMAKVTLEGMEYSPDADTAQPTLRIEAGPKVHVRVRGAKIPLSRLRYLIPVFQEQSVDDALLIEGRRSLTEYLQSRGYFDAKVDFQTGPAAQGEQTIEYTIDRGVRHRLARVEIEGHRYFDLATIRERIYTTAATHLRFRHGRFSREMLDRDREAIVTLYRTNGFPDVKVAAELVENYQGKRDHLAVYFRITEGAQWFVSSLEVSGVDLKLYPQILAMLTSTAGQPYSEANVVTDRDNILNHYYNNGYPDASVEVLSTPQEASRRVALRYQIREGRRQYVRQILVGGLDATNPELVERRLSLEPGDPLSQEKMIESQRRLYDLGVFAKVDVAVQNPDGVTRNKYVLYQFEEARRYSFTVGLGAEIGRIGGESPAGSAGFSPRVSLGLSRANFLGIGHTGGFQTRLSNIQRRALFTYLAPQFKANENYTLSFSALYDFSRDVRTFTARRWEGTAQFGQRLSRASTMQYRFTYRRVSIDQDTLRIRPELIPVLSQAVRVGLVSVALIHDRRDEPLEPRRGVYSTFDASLATKALASQSDFFRLLARNASYHRIAGDWIFARTSTLGWIENFRSTDIPLAERFFGGGATSHRGFPENQAGPRDLVTGFPIGGNAIFVNQLELRFPLIGENVGGVLFHDAGNVYSNLSKLSFRPTQSNKTEFDYMVHAFGFGIRYRTPVGPIRVDLALSANSPRFVGFEGTLEDLRNGRGRPGVAQRINRFQFHFSLGQSF